MLDPFVQIIVSALTVIVAAGVAIVVGSRKGLADVEARGDVEVSRLVSALEGRIKVLVSELADAVSQTLVLRAEVAALRIEVAALKAELATEQRITARLTRAAEK